MVITGREVDHIKDDVCHATAMACPMTATHILESVWYYIFFYLILNHISFEKVVIPHLPFHLIFVPFIFNDTMSLICEKILHRL